MRHNLIFCYFKESPLLVAVYLPVAVIHGLSTLLLPLITGAFFDIYFNTATGKSRLLGMLGISPATTSQFFLLFAVCIAAKGILAYAERRLSLSLADGFSFSLTRRLFETQMGWPHAYFARKPYGNYLLRYSGELTSSRNLMMKGWLGSVKHGCILLSGIGLLFMISQLLTIQLLLSMLLLLPLVYRVSRQQHIITALRNRKSSLLSFITDRFGKHAAISAAPGEQHKTVRQFAKKQKAVMEASLKNRKKQSLVYAFTAVAGYGFVILLLTWIVATPDLYMHPSDLLLYMLVLFTLLSTIRSLLRIPAVFQKGKVSLRKVEDILFADTATSSESQRQLALDHKGISVK